MLCTSSFWPVGRDTKQGEAAVPDPWCEHSSPKAKEAWSSSAQSESHVHLDLGRAALLCTSWRLRRHYPGCLLKREVCTAAASRTAPGWSIVSHGPPQLDKMQVWVCVSCHHRYSNVPDSSCQRNAVSFKSECHRLLHYVCSPRAPE